MLLQTRVRGHAHALQRGGRPERRQLPALRARQDHQQRPDQQLHLASQAAQARQQLGQRGHLGVAQDARCAQLVKRGYQAQLPPGPVLHQGPKDALPDAAGLQSSGRHGAARHSSW
jgi:hypothetical protein